MGPGKHKAEAKIYHRWSKTLLAWLLFLGWGMLVAMPVHAQEVQEVRTQGGFYALLVEDHSLPVLSLRLTFRSGGSAYDPADKQGLAQLAAAMLREGAGAYDAEAFEAALQYHAIRLDIHPETDRFSVAVKMLRAHRDTAVALLAALLVSPHFPEEALPRNRDTLIAIQRQRAQQPSIVAAEAWNALAFPDHPYGRKAYGDSATAARLTSDDLRRFMTQHITRDNLVISAAGDITATELASLLDQAMAALPAASAEPPAPIADTVMRAGLAQRIQRETPQTVLIFGQPGIARQDPDFYAAYLLNYLLGSGGFSSRLTDALREKTGLVYGVDTDLLDFEHAAILSGMAATRPERAAEAWTLIRRVWRDAAAQGFTAGELADAKRHITASFPLSLDRNEKLTGYLQAMQLEALGTDYLHRRNDYFDAVTLEQVNALARRLLDPAALTMMAVGKPAQP